MNPPAPLDEAAAPPAPGDAPDRADRIAELTPERRMLLRRLLEERAGAKRAAAVPDIPRRRGDGPVPLSFAQQRLWFIDQLEPGSSAYNMPFPMRVRGALDPRVLARALGEIARRHESLRTVFAVREGEPVQVVRPPAPARLPAVDLAGLAAEACEREVRRLADEDSLRGFELARGPLLRSTLVRLGERESAVLFTMHHIVSDGWSLGVLVREVSVLYTSFARGGPSPLPEPPLQYPDFAVWQRGHVSGARLEEQVRYWKDRLADAPPLLELPTDRPRPPVEDPRGAMASFVVPGSTVGGLRALARSEGGTVFMVLLAGLQALLARWSGQDDVLVGSPIANRVRVELEGLIGFFVNTLVMRTDLSGDPTVRGLLARVRAGVLGAQSNQDLPFERLVEEVQPERSLAHSPLFQVLFALQNAEGGSLELGELEMRPMGGRSDTAKFDLTFNAEEHGDRVAVSLSYRTALWDAATVRRLLEHLGAVLAGMAADPEARVWGLELLTGGEREQVVRRWNATESEYAREGGLPALFRAQAARTPDVPAAVFGAEALTYAELDARSDALADRLRALGAGPDVRVGLCVERSLEMVVGVLGTLKAGAAYVPIDPAYPEDRVAYMLDDAGISVLLTQARLGPRLPRTGGETVLLEAPSPPGPLSPASGRKGENDNSALTPRLPPLPSSGAREACGAMLGEGENGDDTSLAPLPLAGEGLGRGPSASPENLAYVIYTSGSTGRPKGVAMPQRPLLNLLAWQLRSWHGPGAARTLQFASISFDVSFQEIFSTWASGGTLLVVPEEVRTDMARLARFLAEARVERIFLPFIALQHLAEAAEAEGIVPASLREVVTAGEQLRVTEPIRRWLARIPGCALVNQYGPSETHVVTALALAGDPEAWPALPGIGGPIANTQCYVLDRDLRPAPVGVPGELFLGGDGVARGYLGRPELTADRFVPDPFALRRGARLYRTGDRARWLPSGELEFLGRTDQQVKVRGFRIEPGEVEAALEAHPAVREAVVVVREDAPGERRLVAYPVPAAGEAVPGAPELRAWLAARLPEYMVPAAFVALEALPLTASGKIHRRALPAPDAASAGESHVAPRTPAEATLAGIFAEVLRRERVGVHDGFFALGGHSLLATRVASRVRDAFGAELPLRAMFETPTVAGLAERIQRLRGDGPAAPLRIPRRAGEGPVPLSFAQQRLWFIDRMEPGSAAYNLPAGLRLRGALDTRTLERTLTEVVRRHESLRTVLGVEGGEPVQRVLPAARVRLPLVELGALAPEARERELRRLAAEEAGRPFDLARGPLLRSALLRLGPADHATLFTMHHVVSDGWSMGVLVNEVSALYAAFAEGRPSPLPELPVQYPDYAVWQRGWLTGDTLEAQLAFWRERLAGAPPVLELPTDRPRPPVPGARADGVPFGLPETAARGLRALAAREGTTLFAALLAAFAAVLARWSGQDDVVVGTPIAGRTRSELEGLIGFFVNTLALRTGVDGDPTLRELLARARETVLGAQAHQDVPFERLVEELRVERSLQHTPLFQVMLALQNNERGELRLGALEMEPLGGGAHAARFDLDLSLAEDGDRVAGTAFFRAALWERATVARMMDHLRAVLEALAADPGRRLSDLELLSGEERARVLGAWSASPRDYPALPAHALFAEAARRAPDAVALASGGGALTYAELDARSDALALRLRALGVAPETPVGLCVERTPEMVVGVLGIWKAGGAYVPLDPSYPAERLALILADAALPVVVATAAAAAALPVHGARVVAPDRQAPSPSPSPISGGGENDDDTSLAPLPLAGEGLGRGPSASPDHLAYVIHTSGSTGTPRGVLVEHRSLSGLLHAAREAFDVRAGDVVPSLASFAFDIWLFETILPLTVGATARLVARERVMDPARLVEEVGDATLLHAVPALMRQVVSEVRSAPEPRLAGVRRVLVGGDLVPPDLLAEMREAFPRAAVFVTYGPTEAAVLASRHAVPAQGAVEGHRIGTPLGNVRLYVCDPLGSPQPVGVPGELRVGGVQVARGYLGRPELTAERFVPDPFSGEPGARAYRTGDRVRWLPPGELEFLGRLDAQVKVRGFRIEPGEVEAALLGHPGVREAVVVARGDAPGERRLVAYAVAAEGPAADGAELRAFLGARLPEHMVPSAVVVLDALPLTPSGKVDRRALPAPDAAAEAGYVAPRTPAEEALARIWAEVLKTDRVGVHDDFFALGGHSLLAARVAARVHDAFGAELPLRDIFEAPTVAALAQRVKGEAPAPEPGVDAALAELSPERRRLLRKRLARLALQAQGRGEDGGGERREQPRGIRRVPRDGPLPASFAQQRLWFIDRLQPGGSAYNIPFPLRLRGAVDPRALRGALTGLVARHETLRTTFAEADGGAVQVIHPPAPARIPAVDLRALPAEARERETRRLVAAEAARPFDLERGPLLRALLLRLDEAEWGLCLVVHHIVSDGLSTGVIVRDVSELYAAAAEGRAPVLPELPVQYADYAVWQRERLGGDGLERQVEWWRGQLAGIPPTLELPLDRPRTAAAVSDAPGSGRGLLLPADVSRALRAMAREQGATLFMAALAAWQLLLARYAATDDVPVGTAVAGRSRVELEGLIGFFVNTLVLRTDLSGDPTFRELLGRVRETTLGAFGHQEVPFEKLVEELAPERSLGRTPFFQVMFALQNLDTGKLAMGGAEVAPLGTAVETVKFDLTLTLADPGERIGATLSFRTDLFDGSTVERMLEHFGTLLAGIAADPGRRSTEVPLLTAAERELVLERWNDTARPFPDGETLHGLFARQAARDPEGTAVVFGGRGVSRAELDRRSARLAHALRRRGVGPESRVALYLEPSVEAVVALLGVMRAGGAYVPLDTAAPAERIAYLLEDSAAELVLAAPASDGAMAPHGVPVLHVTADAFADEPETAPETGVAAENLAYVIYTSGSTGRPKGVMVPHRGVVNSTGGFIEVYGIRPESRVLLFAPLHFDASVLDVFTALCSRAALVVAPREELMPGEELAGLLRRERVTHVKGTPSAMVVTPPEGLPELETVGLGGETCGADLVARWAPGRRLFNGYGATEHSVRCTALLCTDASRPPPVGRPIANARLYVLDAGLQPVPVGVPGEVYMAGVGVTRGYLNRPELTAERFVPDAWSGEPGARMYRSGDRGRWRADGALEFIGRTDFQVKIRGFRIEPGEIEAALLEHPALLDAVVVARDDGAGGRLLAAYAAPAAGAAAPRPAELRAHLRERLPEYMVPASFTVLEALPLTSNGKVDRRALPAPELAPDADAYVAPRTPTEATLAAVWAEVLKLERVGIRDEFFALGGHSLVATRVVARAREAFGVEVPLRAIFEAPTVAGLAERVDALLRADEAAAASSAAPSGELSPEGQELLREVLRRRAEEKARAQRITPRTGAGPVPLSFAQQRLWFIQQMDPRSSAYNMPYPLRLRGRLDVAALERALTELVRRHESLRTVFAATAGEPVQVVRPAAPQRLPVADLSGLPAAAREAEVWRRVAGESARPFDLARGPLLRAWLFRLAADEWGLMFNLHHIVSDGWSSGVLTREVSALYGAFSRGRPSPLAPLPVQYPDFALWQRERIGGEALEAQVRFWRGALEGAPPVLELPTDRPRTGSPGARGEGVPFALSREATAGLRELGRRDGATQFMILLAAFQALLARWSGQDDVSVGTPTAGRDRVELEGLIGFFVNTLVLRTRLDGTERAPFRALLGRVRETTLGAFANQDVPFEKLVEELRVERSLRHTPLFQVMFALQNMDRGELRMGDLEVGGLARGEDIAKFDLSVTLVEDAEQVRGGFTFRTDLYDRATMERMAEHFGRLLEAVAADPALPVSEVEILGDAERRRVLEEWNAVGVPVADERPVHEIFATQAARTPDAVAVRSGAGTLTYAELDARSDRLAGVLRTMGVGPETRVGLCVERGPEVLVGVLGILKVGGAYVPLDPAYPAERLAFMLADSAVPVLVAPPHLAEALPEHGAAVVAPSPPGPLSPASGRKGENDDDTSLAPLPLAGEGLGRGPSDLAYVIYTSGSTGRPKGVRITHRALTNTLLTVGEAFGFGAGDVMPSLASFAFDIWLFESLLPLLSGGSVRMVPREHVVDVAALVEEISDATLLHAVPALMRQVVERVRATRGTLPRLRRAFVGGDAVPPDLLGAMREVFPAAEVRVMYGPTEATILCAAHVVTGEVGERHLVGRPIGNAPLFVLDPAGRPAPISVPGELCIGGASVARDYLGRPELTAAQFVPDPFSAEPGARMYRTGDRARWGGDGVLEFLGRIDNQVKIRGFRIEPGEVEAQLAAHPAVRDAIVFVREDVPGEKRLVGYVVLTEDGATTAELKTHLGARLPEYMVPGALVVLDAFPLSPNGKVDRRALPAPEGGDAAEYVAPRTQTEEILAGIWADVLHRERVGVTEDFFALGGHSLLATQVVSRAVSALGVDIPLRALFEAPTVAGLAVRADAALREGVGMQAPPIVPAPRDGSPLPLSFAQQRLWFIDQLEPGSATYNMPFPLRLRGALDVAALEGALAELVRRHESLRTVFATVDGEPVQIVQPAGERRLDVTDLRERAEAEREAEVRRRVGEDAARPFDLTRGPLLRTSLVQVGDEEHVLLVNMHHIVSDAWSMGVLTREVSALYGAFSEGRPSPLPELEVQYPDYAAWQRAWLTGDTLERQIAYWKERLGGAPPLLELPTDHPRPAVASDRGAGRGFALSVEASAGLRALARSEGATLFTVLLAGFGALLSRYAGEDDVLVGTPIAGRTRLETEALIGFFVNTLVIRADLSGEPGGRELVGRVRERVLEAHAHQDLPFERLVDELQVERSLAHAPLFQALFNFTSAGSGGGPEAGGLELGGVEVAPLGTESATAKFDLTLGMSDAGERLGGSLSYRTDLWEGATIERMLAHFTALLEGIVRSPEVPVAELPLLGQGERAQVLAEWNATERPYPAGLRVHDLFAAQAARTPAAVAVSWRGERTTYAELDRRANRLAHALRGRGVGPETRVGVCMSRTPELLVALLGVLKAGGAYVPLDPAYPAERLGYMVEDAGIGLVLTEWRLIGSLPESVVDVLALDQARDAIAAESDDAPESGVLPENLSHVIFTSGSTGRPKGVMIRHSSTVVLMHWLRETVSDEERASVLFSTSINFDVSVAEIFGTLCWGGKLVLVENALELAELPTGEEVVHASMVPSAAAELLRMGGIPASVRTLNLGGEALPAALAQGLYGLGTVDRVGNLYGPTEDTTYSTYSRVERGAPQVLIGRPVANTRAYVLDRHLQPVPAGVVGELYLAGDKLARGYAAWPELTAKRFVPDPFGAAGDRMYRVMDRVRWRADGELEYFGRTDFQVKVRGFRIELGEVEAVLGRHPAVREVVAVVREDAPGDRRIVAYVTAVEGAAPDPAELRAHAGRHLPEYMVPSAVMALDALPLSPNGKTDRRALPQPEAAVDAGAYVAPRTPTERTLAEIWAAVLRTDRVGVNDGFFALGGHSLIATRVISRVREELGAELPLRAIFEAPTVAGLSARIDELLRTEDAAAAADAHAAPAAQAGELSPERQLLLRKLLRKRAGEKREGQQVRPRTVDGPVPLSFAQQRLWFIQQMDPRSSAYNMPSPLRIRGGLDAPAMRRALTELVRRHESLRTVFAATAGEPVQVVRPAAPVRLPVADLGGLPAEAREAEARRLAMEESARPFDLARGPLLRASLFRLADDDWGLVFNLHHIVSDGWSMGVLTREVSALYDAFSRGVPSPLPELPVQYPDFALWQRERIGGETLEAQVRWWRGALEGAPPVLELPTDRPRPPVPTSRAESHAFALSPETTASLRELSQDESVTPFITLLAAFQALMARWSGQADVSVGTPTAGRGRLELEGVIGMFVNTLVLRTRLDGDPSFRALLGRVRETTLGAFSNQDVPFERLVEELRVERSLQHTPLFQVMFALQNNDPGELDLGGLPVEALARGEESAKFDLSVSMVEAGDRILGAVAFRTDLFDAATVERMARHFRNLLDAVSLRADTRLSEVEILDDAERRRVLEEWNAAGVPVADERPVHEIFAAQAARTPDAVAVRSGAGTLSYAELDARSDRLAAVLRAMGVGPETRVGLCVERGPEMLVGVLGILKAGGGYVPLDPAYPAERLAFMLADSAVPVLVAPPHLAEALPEHGAAVVAPSPPGPLSPASGRKGENGNDMSLAPLPLAGEGLGRGPSDLAYVIYTSGSTGRPKGVRITHRALTNTLLTAGEAFGFGAGDTMPSLASFAFDIWLFESLLPLLTGGSVRMVPREHVVDVAALVEEISDATLLHAVPALMRQVVERVRATRGTLPGLRRAFVGGDAVPPDLLGAMRETFPGAEVRVLYGPTEATIICAAHAATGEEAGERHLLGRPIGNAPLYVLDPAGRPAPIGVPGELCIGGASVARDYLGRPELTAAQFVPDPFSAEPGARMYRTGDRVRWGGDGVLEFLGRIDNQVKIRGFRIEPGEVEAQLAAHPAVRDAIVLVREDVPGEKRLVGYVVPAEDGVSTAELKAHLGARLPEYMVPGALVVLDAFPLSPNGKVDRRALPAPEGGDAAEYVAPRTQTEEILAGIWADVLHRERVGVTEDFFALGGHSLLATQVVSRAVAALGVDIPLRALFEAPTVAGLAIRADAALREGVGMQAPPITPVPRDGSPLPLSFAQQRLWFIDQLEPGSATYNMPFPLRLRGALDPAALEGALAELVRRHESLRTVFATVDGEPVQVVQPAGERRLETTDLRERPEGEREAEVRRRVGEDASRPFDLARGPLLRTSLVRVGDEEHVLLVNMHHIVSDGWSMGVLTREVSALYGALSGGRPSPLPELEVQYADYAAWQRAWLVGETLERQIAYWKERLGGAPPLLELPTDHPRPAVASDRGGVRGFGLSAEATAGLRALSRREGATLFTVLLAGFGALLSRYAGEDDVLVGTPIAGRTRLETEALIGFFVNTLVIRADLSGEPGGRELVGRVRERVLEAHAHQDLPFERLVDELQVERSRAHAPLFQAMFNFSAARDAGDALDLGGVQVEAVGAASGTEKFDLTLGVTDAGERFVGSLSYRTDLWEGATIERMAGHLAALFEGMAREPERPFTEIAFLPEAERAQVLAEWNATERPYPAGLRVHDLFQAQAARTPDAVAVSWRGEGTTYGELDRRANRLAHALRGRGVGPETRVGVCMSRTPELLVALLGVLKAGGAYVPLDPAYPAERLGYMVEDAGIGLVLTEWRLIGSLPESVADVLALDQARDAIAVESDDVPESGVLPENLSHVIFTSGSTGRPKGVMIRHSSTVVLMHWLRETVSDEERASVLFSTSINFDVSVAEIFGTLCWGGKLVLVENALELADLPAGEEVVHASMVPSAAAELLRMGGIPASVRTLNLGGEALPNALAQGLYGLGTVERVGNLYGPTEDTTYSTYSLVERGAPQVLIGRPVANTRAYVLDRHLQPVPAGVVGELYLAGDKLARGYVSRPELTAERFVPDPFGAAGDRMYRVMDRVRWRADGELEYFGRTDFQVKVRGFRIELGEIEAVLGRHPAVREVVAVVREDAPGDRRIVAYVTAAEGTAPHAAELRAHAGRHLPEYMVPSAVVALDALPLSPNGKTDRRALPAPEWAQGGREGGYVAPRDTLELALARIWEETLGVPQVGVRDSFFALGGHSLLAVRLMSRVERATGARLPLATLFTAPTVERLAEELRRGDAGRDDGPVLVPVRPGGDRTPLFLVHPVGGDVLAYAALARRLDPEQPVYGLRSRGLAGGAEPARSVEEMARDYLAAVREAQPAGPYRLGGWSMGGVVAFEMARQLEAAGERVERLLLVDAHVPALHGRALPRDEAVLVQVFAQDMGLPPERLSLPEGDAAADGREYLRRVLEGARAAGLVPPDLDPERIEHLYAVFRANIAALYDYRPAPWAGAATLLRAAEHDPRETESAGWERLAAGGVDVRVVPGSHFTMVREPHAEALAGEVERALGG